MAPDTSIKKVSKLTRNSKLLKVIIQSIRDKKGENILSLDLRKIDEAVADFFIICEASSNTQVKAIADNVEEQVKKETGESPYRSEGRTALHWVLVDYINVVIHIMLPDTRKHYNLEDLWFDAPGQKIEN